MNLYLNMEGSEIYEGAVWCFYANWIDFLLNKTDDEDLIEIRNALEYAPSCSSREVKAIRDSIKLSKEHETIYLQWLTLRRLHGYESPPKENVRKALRGLR